MNISKSKHCDYTFAISHLEQAEEIILSLPDFPIWAYIKHDPDDEHGSTHYHFYIHLQQPISISNLSEKLDIPPNMIEWVRVKTKLIQYLIHKNNPEKKQYSPDMIITNNREYIQNFLDPKNSSVNLHSEISDYSDLACGRITINEFLDKHSSSISSLPFYSRSIYLMRLFKIAERGSSNYYSKH